MNTIVSICRSTNKNIDAMEGLKSDLMELFGLVCRAQKEEGATATEELIQALNNRAHLLMARVYAETDRLLKETPEVGDILRTYRYNSLSLFNTIWRLLMVKVARIDALEVVEVVDGMAQTIEEDFPVHAIGTQTDVEIEPLIPEDLVVIDLEVLLDRSSITEEAGGEDAPIIELADAAVGSTDEHDSSPSGTHRYDDLIREVVDEIRQEGGAANMAPSPSRQERQEAMRRVRQANKENTPSSLALPRSERRVYRTTTMHCGSDASEKSFRSDETPVSRRSRVVRKRTAGMQSPPSSSSSRAASEANEGSSQRISRRKRVRRHDPLRSANGARRNESPRSAHSAHRNVSPQSDIHRATPSRHSNDAHRNTTPRSTTSTHSRHATPRQQPAAGGYQAHLHTPSGGVGNDFCRICELPASHPSHRCPRWRSGEIHRRYEEVIAGKHLCHKCLRDRAKHNGYPCRLENGCRCGERCQCGSTHKHNSLLCIAPKKRSGA